ncbi:MAG: hypothetical protein PCFJNLEI_01381 [Verrucomicrobiae bacterium]|nr:hypothetical protein [Verrucomicrobiae bacterium]
MNAIGVARSANLTRPAGLDSSSGCQSTVITGRWVIGESTMDSKITAVITPNDNAASHEWWVFSTCLDTAELMLICTKTDAFAVVPQPTAAEWQQAYWAPKRPYRWPDSKRGRVVVKWPTGAHTLCHTAETRRLAQAVFTPSLISGR